MVYILYMYYIYMGFSMKMVISNASQDPIYEQIARQIREQSIRGELSAGDALPSIRNLAKYCSGFVYAAVGLLATALMSWIISGLGRLSR